MPKSTSVSLGGGSKNMPTESCLKTSSSMIDHPVLILASFCAMFWVQITLVFGAVVGLILIDGFKRIVVFDCWSTVMEERHQGCHRLGKARTNDETVTRD